MSVIQSGLFMVLNRFPEHGETVRRLYKTDSTFQSLCEDYIQCREALRYWRGSESCQAASLSQEYAALLKELESELLEAMDGVKQGVK